MLTRALYRFASALLAVPFITAASAQSGEFRKTVPVSDHADVYVTTSSGNIRVTSTDAQAVTIIGHIHAGWPHLSDVQGRIQQIVANPPIQQAGSAVRIGESSDPSLLKQVSIDYDVQVPRGAALNLRSGSGDVEVAGVGRYIAANSGSGNIKVHGLHGSAEVHTGSGDIDLVQDGRGEVHARTGSGTLHLAGLDGPLEAHTGSGNVEASGLLTGPSEISCGSGDVRISFAAQSRVDVKAQTGSGDISADLPSLQILSKDKHTLQAKLNGGGAPLTLHTGSGSIDLRQQ